MVTHPFSFKRDIKVEKKKIQLLAVLAFYISLFKHICKFWLLSNQMGSTRTHFYKFPVKTKYYLSFYFHHKTTVEFTHFSLSTRVWLSLCNWRAASHTSGSVLCDYGHLHTSIKTLTLNKNFKWVKRKLTVIWYWQMRRSDNGCTERQSGYGSIKIHGISWSDVLQWYFYQL